MTEASLNEPIVQVAGLVKKYGDLTAVNDISFEIQTGEVFGLLGPNGAGKSTTIAMLSCLFPPSAGSVRITGLNVVADSKKVRQIIGVTPQDLALYPTLSGRENVRFFGEMYGFGGKDLRQRTDEVLDYVAMRERANDRVDTYSGGMKRRINLAVALVSRPRVLFLDEPTVGVDPQSRNHIFESVERLNREWGMTILYTTHYMEEAERLCQRVGIIDHGKIIALDTPANLIAMLGGGIIEIGLEQANEDLRSAVAALPTVQSATFAETNADEAAIDERPTLKVETKRQEVALIEIINLFGQRDVAMLSMKTLEPNLESVFLHLTGKSLRN
jgi:ABC-2 type transport system ATP-binding protein